MSGRGISVWEGGPCLGWFSGIKKVGSKHPTGMLSCYSV